MTTQQLNKDIKRLVKECSLLSNGFDINHPGYAQQLERCKKEFTRLYHADDSMKSMNKNSIMWLLRLNVRYRFIPLHNFGLMINLPNE